MSDNENNTETTTSLSLEDSWSLWQVAKKAVESAKDDADEALRTVARAAGAKTFMQDGQLYQIRERKIKGTNEFQPFICALKRAPKEWLADAREAKYEAAEPTVELVADSGVAIAEDVEHVVATDADGSVVLA